MGTCDSVRPPTNDSTSTSRSHETHLSQPTIGLRPGRARDGRCGRSRRANASPHRFVRAVTMAPVSVELMVDCTNSDDGCCCSLMMMTMLLKRSMDSVLGWYHSRTCSRVPTSAQGSRLDHRPQCSASTLDIVSTHGYRFDILLGRPTGPHTYTRCIGSFDPSPHYVCGVCTPTQPRGGRASAAPTPTEGLQTD